MFSHTSRSHRTTHPAHRPLAVAALLGIGALALAGCSSAESPAKAEPAGEALVFAMPPAPEDGDIKESATELKNIISAATGLAVEQEMPADYLGVVEAVRQGHVDVAFMSPFSTALAVKNGSVDPLVVWEADAQKPASYCYSRPDSGIETLEDIKGKQVAFVDPGSATGYFMPKSMLTEAGMVDGTDYTSTFAGGHDTAMLALVNGSVDVACSSIAERLIEAGTFEADDIKQVAATKPLPVGVGIVVAKDMDPAVRAKLLEELPKKLTGNEKLKDLSLTGSYTLNPGIEVYQPLLEVAQNVGVDLEDMR